VALNAAEEETLDSVKRWWQENGKALVAAFIVVFGGYTGWLLYQNSTADQAAAASDLYEEVLTLVLADPDQPLSDADSARVTAIADELRADYSNSIYARYAALFSAQQAVVQNDLQKAEADLQWILDNPELGMFAEVDQGLLLTTSLRLGRVILAQGDAERALELVNSIDPQAYEAGFSELRGDIYLAMDRIVDARDAYIAAQQAGSTSDGLRMKLDNLPDQS
jgi:predicted negative regulator of RcsB-dependent stress response